MDKTTELVTKVAEISPDTFLKMSVVAFGVFLIMIIVLVAYKYILPAIKEYEKKSNNPCTKDCVYKNTFATNTKLLEDSSLMHKTTIGMLEAQKNDLDRKYQEEKETHSQTASALAEININMKLNNQVLQAIFDKTMYRS